MGRIVDGTRLVITRGTYMGEEGVGYAWGRYGPMGDISQSTRGHIQGYNEPCRIEILRDDAELVDCREDGYGVVLLLPSGSSIATDGGPLSVDYGLSASEAIAYGLARVVE